MTPSSAEPLQKQKPTSPQDAIVPLTPATAAIQEAKEGLRRLVRLRTMWPRLERLCPPQSERLWVIGGRPGNYKTQTMWNLAMDMAERRQRVLFVSLEQTTGELAMQAVARFSRIPLDRLTQAHNADSGVLLSESELHALEAAERRIATTELYLRLHGADTHGRSLDDVTRSATRARFDAIFADHIGMIGRGGNERDLDTIPKAIDRLRGLARGEVAKGYRPFVCVTSPLNRDIERSDDEERTPRMSDFRGSGLIESDADLAMILRKRQKAEGDESDTPDVVDGFVLKQRGGRCPVVLQFEAQGSICFVRERAPDVVQVPSRWDDEEREDD